MLQIAGMVMFFFIFLPAVFLCDKKLGIPPPLYYSRSAARIFEIAFFATAGYIMAILFGTPEMEILRITRFLANITSLLAAAVATRWCYWPLKIMIPFGIFLNLLAIAGNGFRMPIDREVAVREGIIFINTPYHFLVSNGVRFPWLIDRWTNSWIVFDAIFSLGDTILFLGMFLSGIVTLLLISKRRNSLTR